MRPGVIGFLLGVILTSLALLLAQRLSVAPVARDLFFRFTTCAFDGPDFPAGYIDQSRVLAHCPLPVAITTTFYDAGYHEVTHADKPGRYGAVVRIKCAGVELHQFITLYHLPRKIFWEQNPLSNSTQFPPELGLDPAVVRAQQADIGGMINNNLIDEGVHVSPKLAVVFAGLSETSPLDPPAVARTSVAARDEAWWYGLRRHIGLAETYPHLVDLPRDYETDPAKRWPLILFLGNADDRGDDLQRIRTSGLAGLIHDGKQLPAIVVSPLCPAGEWWSTLVLSQLLDDICAKYRVDTDRLYITGISAGGDGAWALGLAYPDRFAAIVPICGETDPADAARLRRLPIWTFHGMKDGVVPVGETITMVDAVRKAGGHPHLTLVPEAGHDVWNQAYANPALYTWLLAQRRGQPEMIPDEATKTE